MTPLLAALALLDAAYPILETILTVIAVAGFVSLPVIGAFVVTRKERKNASHR